MCIRDSLKEVKEVKRARLTEYAAAKSTAEYHACLLDTSRCV